MTRGAVLAIAAAIVGLAPRAVADDGAAPISAVRARAIRRDAPIEIDGSLEEGIWGRAPQHTGFMQRAPKDGATPTVETRFAVAYDDDAIYVGVWCEDHAPDRIRALLTRRDVDVVADTVSIGFDSYHDRRTGYVLQVNAANVQRDYLVFDDVTIDDTWDAVWTSGVAITKTGWTAEIRLPLSQLRFPASEAPEWGFQVVRTVGRTQEQMSWSPWPRAAPQIVSKYGTIDGFDRFEPRLRLELLPYVLTGLDIQHVEPGDPLNNRLTWRRSLGLDLKYGLGSAFTLSATVNPDFGQVEVDPSLVNLSPNEVYYTEKRPFFLEGSDLFSLPVGLDGGEGSFYSRRIGAAPPNEPGGYSYTRWPSETTIYGAAKLSGKTRDGWSVGVLEAVTGAADAAFIDDSGARIDEQVAPLTNYTVARVKRDLRGGQTSVGVSATAVERDLEGDFLIDTLPARAYTGGAQLSHRFLDNAWTLDANVVGSVIHGSENAIAFVQQLNRHLYQRPDATHVHLDPTRTSLTGLGATWQVGRLGETKHLRIGTGGDLRTPGLELNDIGFQQFSDRINPYVYAQWHEDEPGDRLLNWQVDGDVFTVTTFEPTLLTYGVDASASAQTTQYWNVAASLSAYSGGWNTQSLRGGPKLRVDASQRYNVSVASDTRRRARFELSGSLGRNGGSGAFNVQGNLGVTIQARSNIDIYAGLSLYHRDDPMQYVTQVEDGAGEEHYVLGRIGQTTASMELRANWTFSPHLSLQVYAQPFLGAGRYTELKDVDNPHSTDFGDRFHVLSGSDYVFADNSYMVNYNGRAYSFGNPDFNVRELRSTIVLRWEYLPGSTLFAIWNHGRSSFDQTRFQLGGDLSALARANNENSFLVKLNYWFGP